MNRVPKLRFPEFSGEWEKKKLGELVQINTGKKDTQDKIGNGIYPFFVRSQTIERINSYSFDGEAILTAGDGVGVGKVFHYINGKFDYHQRVYKLSDFNGVSGKYLFEYFSANFIKEVTKYTAKTSVDSVRMEMLTKMDIPVTSLPEQEEIASFLSSVDSKIEKLERKKELWEQYKKGMMQKIFSQELRFKYENGEDYPEWEEKSLGEVIAYFSGSAFPEKYQGKHDGKYPFYKVSDMNLLGNEIKMIIANNTISEEDRISLKSKLAPKETIIFPKVGAALLTNKRRILTKPSIFDNNVMGIIGTEELNNGFLYHFMNTIDFKIYVQEGALPSVSKGIVDSIIIPLPSLPEQTQIADFLSSLDSKIEIVEKELLGMKEFKKGLLQKMFV